jgi:hypothetical protein
MRCAWILTALVLTAQMLATAAAPGAQAAGGAAAKAPTTLESVCSRTAEYGCYTNHRYGYVLAWPKTMLTPLGEADAGDGQAFASVDGRADLRCWAGFDDAGQTLPAAYAQARQEPGRRVTYAHLGRDFFVVSGFEDGRIFYRKTLLAHGVLAAFELRYEVGLKAAFDPVVRDLAASFTVDPAFRTP